MLQLYEQTAKANPLLMCLAPQFLQGHMYRKVKYGVLVSLCNCWLHNTGLKTPSLQPLDNTAHVAAVFGYGTEDTLELIDNKQCYVSVRWPSWQVL